MCSSGFFPHITVPTRFTTISCSLIDQIYIKEPKLHQDISNNNTSSGVVISNISDHLPCFTSICIPQTKTTPPKFITVNTRSETAINNVKEGFEYTRIQSHLNTDSHGNRNVTHDIIEKYITYAKVTFFSTKTIRFNKHKHRIKSWKTQNILRSIKFRDKLYKQYLSKPLISTEKVILKSNLRVFNKILKKDIREAKKSYYYNEFNKYKRDIKKTWDTIKSLLNKPKQNSGAPKQIKLNSQTIINEKEISSKFNNCFTDIGKMFADTIYTPNKHPFDHYLHSPSISKFRFKQTNPNEVISVMYNLSMKTSSGHDEISCIILK